MDAGLRGNWPHETRALVELGYHVVVVASFPDAGRRCKDGIVYIQDIPVLDSPFGADPLTAPCSSKPIEVMEEAGCVFEEVEVWDANDNDELDFASRQCLEEGRVLVGPSGAIGSFARHVFGVAARAQITLANPMLLACGSLNATSREQLTRVNGEWFAFGAPVRPSARVSLVATPIPAGEITSEMAVKVATEMAQIVKEASPNFSTLLIIGGDTVAAFVGDETLKAVGTVSAGIPVSKFHGQTLITKGGGIGTANSLREIVDLVS